MTGADSAEMGQGGMRVNMVPKDGGNDFHGVVFGNYGAEVLVVRTTAIRRASASRACARSCTATSPTTRTTS